MRLIILLAIITTTCWLQFYGCQANEDDQQHEDSAYVIPNFLRDNEEKRWINIHTKQTITTRVNGALAPIAIWLVEEHVSLDQEISYSEHRRPSTDESYARLTIGQRSYFVPRPSDPSSCVLDHRQDPLTMFPWRHQLTRTGREQQKSLIVHGVAALWLNAIEAKSTCKFLSPDHAKPAKDRKRELNCYMPYDESRRLNMELLFELSTTSDDDDAQLKGAHIDRQQTVHVEHTTSLHDILVEAKVLEMDYSPTLESELSRRIDDLVKHCGENTIESDTIFPSLMRQVAESSRRNYWFSYIVALYDDQDEAKVKEKYRVDEYFSFELERQSIVKLGDYSEERFYSLFAYENPEFNHKTLAFKWAETSKDCEPVKTISNPLNSLSSLTKRTMQFVHNAVTQAYKEHRVHAGILRGLGALLMNVADIRGKSSPVKGFNVTKNDRWLASKVVEWVVDDEIEGLRFHFYLLPRDESHRSRYHNEVADLAKVEIEKIWLPKSDNNKSQNAGSDVDSGEQQALTEDDLFSSKMLMILDILDFSTNLEQTVLDKALNLPETCPPTTNYELNIIADISSEDENSSSVIEETNKRKDQDETVLSPPTFEQYIKLSRDFSISSSWNLGPAMNYSKLKLVEHQRLNSDGRSLSRIDVIRQEGSVASFSIYLNHSIGETAPEFYRVQGRKCKKINEADKWLQKLAYSPEDGPHKGHLFYGVRALWNLASWSSYVEFMGKSHGQTLWKLQDDPKLPNLRAVYRFMLSRLENIEIEASNKSDSNFINIADIEYSSGDFKFSYALPESCNTPIDSGDNDSKTSEFVFPNFSEKFGGFPWAATFTLRYNYIMSDLGTNSSVVFEALEAHKAHSSGRLDLWHNKEYYRLWLTKDNQTLMEQASSGNCKRIRQLHQFLRLDAFIATIAGDQLSPISSMRDSNFAVANLWELFSSRIEMESILPATKGDNNQTPGRVEFLYRNEEKLAEWLIRGPRAIVVFSFEHEGTEIESLKLKTISLRTLGEDKELVRVEMLETYDVLLVADILGLPFNCIKHFPKLTHLLETTNQISLHMRSELSSLQALGGDSTGGPMSTEYFLLDEQYDRKLGFFRSRSSGLKKNFDYLVYNTTREFFDLSEEYKCLTQPAVGTEWPNNTLAKDWILDNLFNSNHHGSFHGPLSLWLFAESLSDLKVEPEFDELDLLDLRDLEVTPEVYFWYSFERWRVYLPSQESLSYTLKFSTETLVGHKSWVVLEQVKSMNWRLNSGGGKPQLFVAEVVYGRDKLSPSEFLLPKGWGCKRNAQFKQKIKRQTTDLMVFDPLSPVEFEYEVSLSVMDTEVGAFLPRPVIHSGWFGRCPGNWEWLPFGVLVFNHQRSHHLNGTLESRKWVLSEGTPGSGVSHRRLLDERRGLCSIWEEHQSPFELLRLDFSQPGKPPEEQIVIDDALMRLLSTESYELEQIQLLNLTSANVSLTEVVYEKRLDKFGLNREISGATSIIRTFQRSPEDPQWGRPYYSHQSVKLEALVLGKAHLTLRLKRLSSRDCIAVLEKVSAEDCHQSTELLIDSQPSQVKTRLRSLNMKLLLTGNMTLEECGDSAWFELLLKQAFIASLVTESLIELSPMQLGRMHFNRNHQDQSVKVKFNLLEQPAAIEYFKKIPGKSLVVKAPISSSNVGQSLVRLLNSKFSCSQWCDSQNCVAFSYCQRDRSCQIVRQTSKASHSTQTKGHAIDLEPDQDTPLGFQLENQDLCEYYFAPRARRGQPLNEAVKRLRTLVDRHNGTQGFTLKLPVKPPKIYAQMVAIELDEITDNSELLDKQLSSDNNDDEQNSAPAIYTMVKPHRSLEPHGTLAKVLKSELLLVRTQGECFERCSRHSCQLVSYCGQQHLCTMLYNISDGFLLHQIVEEQLAHEPKLDCNIYGIDFLLGYREFDNTQIPASHVQLVENVTALECAAICDLGSTLINKQSFDCLSFDYCLNAKTKSSQCYLQKMHVLMDSFDELILGQQSESKNTTSSTGSQCSHYSKSLLADFHQSRGQKFVEHRSIVFQGTELDQCALICRRDDTCLAFEHCRRDHETPPNSCYIRRRDEEIELVQRDYKADELEPDEECSVHRAKYATEEFQIDFNTQQGGHATILGVYLPNYDSWLAQIGQGNLKTIIEIIVLIGMLFSAMVIGSIVHIMYIMITGDRLPMFQH